MNDSTQNIIDLGVSDKKNKNESVATIELDRLKSNSVQEVEQNEVKSDNIDIKFKNNLIYQLDPNQYENKVFESKFVIDIQFTKLQVAKAFLNDQIFLIGLLFTSIQTLMSTFIFPLRQLFIKQNDFTLMIISPIIYLIMLYVQIMTTFTDPGIVGKNENAHLTQNKLDKLKTTIKELNESVKDPISNIQTYRQCDTCQIARLPLVSHCKFCNNCVYDFDHHCNLVMNCVGNRNHLFFVQFIITSTVYMFFCLILHSWILVLIIMEEDLFDWRWSTWWLIAIPFWIFLMKKLGTNVQIEQPVSVVLLIVGLQKVFLNWNLYGLYFISMQISVYFIFWQITEFKRQWNLIGKGINVKVWHQLVDEHGYSYEIEWSWNHIIEFFFKKKRNNSNFGLM